jgi:hypothetical protein
VRPFRLSPDDAIDPLISLLLESNALDIICFPGDRSGAFDGPIFGPRLFDTFAVSSTGEKSRTSGLGSMQSAYGA